MKYEYTHQTIISALECFQFLSYYPLASYLLDIDLGMDCHSYNNYQYVGRLREIVTLMNYSAYLTLYMLIVLHE